jgi:hypothetical protein
MAGSSRIFLARQPLDRRQERGEQVFVQLNVQLGKFGFVRIGIDECYGREIAQERQRGLFGAFAHGEHGCGC